jgi:hypothetical protein
MDDFDYYKREYPIIYSKFKYQKNFYSRDISPFDFIYDGVVIKSRGNSSAIFFNPEKKGSAETLIDLLAYFFYMPSFIDTSNQKLNSTLTNLYENFDLLFHGITNNLKSKDDVVVIDQINHPILLAFYNAALKQPEPLAKCVFLFRIIEYYNTNILQGVRSPKPCIEPLYHQAINHKFIPLDLIPYFGKTKKYYSNQIVKWKSKSKKIFERWNLARLDFGENIYNIARCGVAHGNNSCSIIMHDYSQNYKFISEVNIFQELICRYIIESQNPNLIKQFKLNYRNTEFGHYEKKPRIMITHTI